MFFYCWSQVVEFITLGCKAVNGTPDTGLLHRFALWMLDTVSGLKKRLYRILKNKLTIASDRRHGAGRPDTVYNSEKHAMFWRVKSAVKY